MLNEIILGLLFGFSVCLPVGPINVLILNYATLNIKAALAVGFGAATCDTIYMLLFAVLSTQLPPMFNDILGVFGFVILIYMAISLLRANPQNPSISQGSLSSAELGKIYIKGLFINALNPFVIAFWLGVAPRFNASDYKIAYAVSICGACYIWVALLSLVVSRFARFLSAKILRFVNIVSGLVLIGFAFNLIYKTQLFSMLLGE